MSNLVKNKVDMSLDDIIKLTKSQKRNQGRITQRRGRGRGNRLPAVDGTLRGGVVRNRGRGASRGSIKQIINPVKQFHSNLQRGRRGQRRGRGINRQNSGINTLIQNSTDQQNVQRNIRGRGGRGRGGRGRGLAFTTNRLRQQTAQRQQTAPQIQRVSKVKQQAALLREKQLAIRNLQQAQKNVQTINMAIQKTSRENVVNQLRGINTSHIGQPGGRGRRKLLTSLIRQGNNNLLNNTQPTRQLSNTSVTITNMSALSTVHNVPSTSGRKRWRWRRNNNNQVASNPFSIQVANQNLQPVRNQQNSIMNELKLLKPAVTTTYKFQKSVFATPATGVSLNDRFSATTFTDADNGVPEERKVYI
uniref:UAP56-interacting factor n=1 Tax=Arion vulgaris TaxID=1028688 RepID=A0A0B7ABD3_9EUPU